MTFPNIDLDIGLQDFWFQTFLIISIGIAVFEYNTWISTDMTEIYTYFIQSCFIFM